MTWRRRPARCWRAMRLAIRLVRPINPRVHAPGRYKALGDVLNARLCRPRKTHRSRLSPYFAESNSMIDLDTPFHRKVAKLKAPTSAAFDAGAWRDLLDEKPSHSDLKLLAGALLIAAEMGAFRALPADSERAAIDPATETALCIAAMNSEYLTAMNLSGEASRQAMKAGGVSYGHVMGAQFETGMGQTADAMTIVDTAVDAGESWLFDIDPAKQTTGVAGADLRGLAMRMVQRYSVQYGFNSIWKQCLWEGWRPSSAKEVNLWRPEDIDLAKLLEATRVRQAENLMNFPHIDQSAWRMMTPEGRRNRAL